jgi:hypothetical protein
MSGKSSVGNMHSKRDTKFSSSEGKKEDGKNAYFFKATKSDCNGYVLLGIDTAHLMRL